jgi:hypothetical protein
MGRSVNPESGEMQANRTSPTALLTLLYVVILLVGVHSLVLGAWIYFGTGGFYRLFFATEVENFFFVKQAGLFLFCLGLFYLWPLVDIRKHHRAVAMTVLTKLLAVAFLLSSARLTAAPATIVLVALGDGLMAALLAISYVACKARGVI